MTAPIPPQPGSLTATVRAKLSPEMQRLCVALDDLMAHDWSVAASAGVETWRRGFLAGVSVAIGVIEKGPA